MQSPLLWTILLLLFHCCLSLLPGEVPPGNGYFYWDDGGFENNCPMDTCKRDCAVGFYRSGCFGNSSGSCIPCNNAKPGNSSYTTNGGLVSDCAWDCNTGFTKINLTCVSANQCNKLGGIPANSVYSSTSNSPNCDHQCIAGYYNAQASTNPTSCSACPAGAYSSQGATVCSDCQAGTYSTVLASPNNLNCQSCVPGKYSPTARATSISVCISCQAGTYSTTSGASSSSVCQGCPAGTASQALGANNAAACVVCVVGKFSNTTGTTSCTNCAAGTFMNITGATKCYNCNPNTYADITGLSACSLCQYCSQGNFRSGCGPISAGFCDACSNPMVQ